MDVNNTGYNFDKIKGSEKWTQIVPVEGGFSGDKKYYILDSNGAEYLLRLSSIKIYRHRKKQRKLLARFDCLNLNMTRILDMGKLDKTHMFTVTTWIKGEKVSEVIGSYSEREQYEFGVKAGGMIRKLHAIPYSPKRGESWAKNYKIRETKALNKIKKIPVRVSGIDCAIDYIKKNGEVMNDRPITVTHGDCHIGNMVIDNGIIGFVDVDRCKVVDPYYELCSWWWNVDEGSECFATGIIDGYFAGHIAKDFFKVLSVYTALGMVIHISWAYGYSSKESERANSIAKLMLRSWDNFKLDVPTWYKIDAKFECN